MGAVEGHGGWCSWQWQADRCQGGARENGAAGRVESTSADGAPKCTREDGASGRDGGAQGPGEQTRGPRRIPKGRGG